MVSPGVPTPNAVPPDPATTQAVAAPGQPGVASAAAQPVDPATVQAPEYAVVLDHVNKRFSDVVAVNDISMYVQRGTVLGVIGPSGAGKTTTIRIISGGLAPDSGTVQVLGEDPRRFKRRTREAIGYMPQLFVLYPDLTAQENVNFMAALFGIPVWRRGKRVRQVLELVDLWEARDRRASKMSGGMQRRLELACALVHQPSLLILDEPTAGIDPLLRTRIWEEIARLRAIGVTVLVTTQYVSEAEYCDAVALISEGDLVAHAAPADLRRMALGGEMIEVATHAPLDARTLPAIEHVVGVTQSDPQHFTFVVEDAGLANPLVNDAIEQAGGSVEFIREYRPNFDEVFAALVRGHSDRKTAAQQAAAMQAAQPGQGG